PPGCRMFDQKDEGCADFTADRQSLDETQQYQQHRRRWADLLVGGKQPDQDVGTAMRMTDAVSAALRPILSPMWPKTRLPSGRMRKPAAKTPNAASSEEIGSS